jgi:hypothetical protein
MSVRARAKKLGSSKPLKRWSPEEDAFVRDSHGKLFLRDVAAALDRGISEVSSRSKILGLAKWRKDRKGNHSGRPIDGFINGRPVYTHRRVVEQIIGRPLRSDEIVHHIDFDKGNNSAENLYVFPDRGSHRKAHSSFERIVPELVKRNIIFFNPITKSYELCETNK